MRCAIDHGSSCSTILGDVRPAQARDQRRNILRSHHHTVNIEPQPSLEASPSVQKQRESVCDWTVQKKPTYRSGYKMIPQLPSRNRTPRRRENTDGSTSSTFLASESSFNRSKSQAVEQLLDRKESITYKHEWRIEDVSQLAAHVEGQASGSGTSEGSSRDHDGHEAQESPSEILRAGRKSADEMFKFDLGSSPSLQS